MKRFPKILVSFLLFVNGSLAIYGGLSMILYPDGSGIHLSAELLNYSFFESFLWPGIILTGVGLFNIYTMIPVIACFSYRWLYVMAQGVIIVLLLTIQMAFIHFVGFIHAILSVIAYLLIISGISMATYQSDLNSPKILEEKV